MLIKLRTTNGSTYIGANLDELIQLMSSDLDIGGPRTIYADDGQHEVRVSLEEGVTEYAKDGGKLYWINQ